ncbi:MAG: sugar phosphate isomerase/epimerase [Armatimonadetes bacterium]|nr:sugar phosphate isomerase/epimerase [Armatimonadota bacterium]
MLKTSNRAAMKLEAKGDAHPLAWAFERGKKLGFDGLELCLEADAWAFKTPGAWPQEWKDGIKALCKQHGMSIFSLSSDWAWAYASFCPELKQWGRGVELLAEDARLAKELGAHTILMHFGTAKGSWEDCRALIKEAAAAGKESGIAFGYEANIWVRLGFGDLDSLCRMTDEVASPHFGVYLHNAYPRAGLPLQDEIEQSGKRLVKAMHSSSLTSGRVQIDFEKAFAAMKQHFADGSYTFEVPWDQVEADKKLLDDMIAKYW